jgi:hypothetical protein
VLVLGPTLEAVDLFVRQVPTALLGQLRERLIAGMVCTGRLIIEELFPSPEALLEDPSPTQSAQFSRRVRYLAATYREFEVDLQWYAGWPDDRLRTTSEVRLQINAWAARLVNAVRLAEISLARA